MPSLIGTKIAERYRFDQFLGRGGMAEVYKVWDSKRATYLALKLLHEDLALDRVFFRRFQRAGQHLSQLKHPNIVRFYGLEQDGRQAFILLDFVEGETLKQRIFDAEGPMVSREILEVTRGVCSALHYAHSEGLVHCDIKPANIMIDQHGKVLVLDFGIARLTDEATATMVGAGTPAYMSPEQVKGLNPTPQTDIYAMGILLYEMLTGGERPFIGERADTTGTTNAKVRWEQVNLAPSSPRRYNPEVSTAMETVVLKCLAKEPKDRYQTPLELSEAIVLVLGRESVAPPDERLRRGSTHSNNQEKVQSSSRPISSWWRKRGSWIGAGGLLIVAVAGLMLGKRGTPAKPLPYATPFYTEINTLTQSPTATSTITPIPTLKPTSTTIPTSTPKPTSTISPSINITADGIDSEWKNIHPQLVDKINDSKAGTKTDIQSVTMFEGDDNIYIMIKVTDPSYGKEWIQATIELNFDLNSSLNCGHEYDIHTNINSNNRLYAWFSCNGKLEKLYLPGVVVTWGDVIEVSIPKSSLEKYETISYAKPIYAGFWTNHNGRWQTVDRVGSVQ